MCLQLSNITCLREIVLYLLRMWGNVLGRGDFLIRKNDFFGGTKWRGEWDIVELCGFV